MDDVTLQARAKHIADRLDTRRRTDDLSTLLHAGNDLHSLLSRTLRTVQDTRSIGRAIEATGAPNLGSGDFNKALGAFRRGRSTHNANVLQQGSSDSLKNSAKKYEEVAGRWVQTVWKQQFGRFASHVERGALQRGTGSSVMRIRSLAQTLTTLEKQHPINDRSEIASRLGEDSEQWITQLNALDEELMSLFAAVDAEVEQLPAEVQELLTKASSADGFPLEDLTPELLAAARIAGVAAAMVVRQ